MHRLLVLLFTTLICYSLSVGAVVYQNSTNPPPSCNSYTGSTPATASFLTFNTVVQRADRNGNFQNVTAIITTSFTNFSGPTLNRLNTTATWITNPLVTLTIDCPADGSACPFGSNSSSSVDVTDVTLTVFVSPGTNITLSSIQFSFDFPVTGATASYSYNQIVDPQPALDTFPTCQYINSVFTDLPAFNYELGYGYGEGRRITGDAELACGATCSNSASASITPSITPTPSISISNTPSISLTSTPSTSITSTPSTSLTSTPSTSITSTPSTSLTSTPSTSITSTPSNIPSVSNSPSSSPTSGASLSSTPSTTPSSSVSVSTSASASFVPSVSSTSSVSNSPSASGTSGASLSTTPSVSVSNTPSASFVPSASSTPSSSPSVSASSSASVVPSQSPLGPLPSLTSSASQSYYPSYSPYPSPEPPTCVPTEVCCCDARRAEQALLISDLDDLQATAQRIDSRINSLDDVQSQVEALSAVNSQLKRIQSLLDSIQNP